MIALARKATEPEGGVKRLNFLISRITGQVEYWSAGTCPVTALIGSLGCRWEYSHDTEQLGEVKGQIRPA